VAINREMASGAALACSGSLRTAPGPTLPVIYLAATTTDPDAELDG
jgi:hypothetical protein